MDLGDLRVVGVEMAARKGIRVDDHALEDAAIRHHVLDNADAVSVTVVDGGSFFQREIGDRRSELIGLRWSLTHGGSVGRARADPSADRQHGRGGIREAAAIARTCACAGSVATGCSEGLRDGHACCDRSRAEPIKRSACGRSWCRSQGVATGSRADRSNSYMAVTSPMLATCSRSSNGSSGVM